MGIYRWYSAALLVVVMTTSAMAATITTSVPRASVETLLKNASPVLNENPLGYVQAYDSPFQYQQRPYSAPVKQSIKIPTPAIKDALKGALKQQAAVAVATAAVSAAVAAAGWVIDEAGQPVKKIPGGTTTNDGSSGTYYWTVGSISQKFPTSTDACYAFQKQRSGDSYKNRSVDETTFYCLVYSGSSAIDESYVNRGGSTCSSGSNYNSSDGGCYAPSTTALVDSDYDSLTSIIDNQDSPTKAAIADAACKASTSPARCYQALQDAASFLNSGPSSIKGPTTSSVSTTKNADGTTSTTTTSSQTNFDMQYTGDKVSATPTKTTTTKNPDGSVTETEEKEDDNSTTVQTPGEEEEGEDPLEKEYTFANPDMPKVSSFYEQKYPDGLKSVWDDNKSRFDNSAFISFMRSFVPSFSGSCPTWGLPMNIMAQASYGYVTFANICYVFDFVKIVIIATAAFTARKIMFGG